MKNPENPLNITVGKPFPALRRGAAPKTSVIPSGILVATFVLLLVTPQANSQKLISIPRADGAQTPMRVYAPAGAACAPLAIVSHGAGGSEDGYTYLAKGLKDHGWTTIVVGHKESGPAVFRSEILHHGLRDGVQNLVTDANAYKDRFLDIGAALKWAGSKCKPPYQMLLGHSMGAETVFLEAGANNNLGLTGANRFDSYVAISPAGVGPVFPPHAWRNIHKPLLVLTGTKDRSPTGDWKSRTDAYYDLPPGCHWLGVVDGASHLNFAGVGFGAAKTEALALPLIYSFLNDAQKGECPLPPKVAGLTLSRPNSLCANATFKLTIMRRFLSFRDFDWTLLAFVLALSIISVLEIYSATLHTQFSHFYEKQMLWLSGGLVCMFILSLIDYHILLDIAIWAYGICLVALVAVLAVGTKVMGGRRWIKLPGGIHFQPSEWVKLVLVIAVARYFTNLSGRDLTWTDIFKAMAFVCVPMLLVLKQPDLGTALTYAPVLLVGLFLGGIRFKQAAILCLAAGLAIVPAWYKVLKPYQKQRLTSFMQPDADPRGSGYQIRQSLIAVGSGGIWGQGAEHGSQTQGDFLPIPYTDFIFAAFCEEHGLVGGIFVLLVYFLLLMRLVQNAQTAADLPGTLIIMGVVAVLIFQIAVNVGMVIGFMPVTGIPLPLMSYGGSSVLFTFLALGIVMNIRMSRFVN